MWTTECKAFPTYHRKKSNCYGSKTKRLKLTLTSKAKSTQTYYYPPKSYQITTLKFKISSMS